MIPFPFDSPQRKEMTISKTKKKLSIIFNLFLAMRTNEKGGERMFAPPLFDSVILFYGSRYI